MRKIITLTVVAAAFIISPIAQAENSEQTNGKVDYAELIQPTLDGAPIMDPYG